MATVINNPPASSDNSGGGTGTLLGVIIAIVIIALFFLYALPAIRGTNRGTNVNVPERVDINLNQPQQ